MGEKNSREIRPFDKAPFSPLRVFAALRQGGFCEGKLLKQKGKKFSSAESAKSARFVDKERRIVQGGEGEREGGPPQMAWQAWTKIETRKAKLGRSHSTNGGGKADVCVAGMRPEGRALWLAAVGFIQTRAARSAA